MSFACFNLFLDFESMIFNIFSVSMHITKPGSPNAFLQLFLEFEKYQRMKKWPEMSKVHCYVSPLHKVYGQSTKASELEVVEGFSSFLHFSILFYTASN